LSCAVFDNRPEDPEEQGGKNAAHGGIEHGVFEVFTCNKAHQKGENEAGKTSDEREILHVGRWV
jgi:hypothetical protein